MPSPNWPNRTLFHGDNLTFLRAMNSESVDLIATDPPFNKGRDFHATPDSLAAGAKFQDRWSWERDVHQEWVDQITDDSPRLMEAIECARYAHSDGMGAFMCFMAVRLLEMHRILKPTGSIYLHCDPTASHYLKAVMDAIFGWKQFRNEIVWCYKSGGASKKTFAKKHDIILRHTKSNSCIYNPQKEKSYMGVGYGTGNKNVKLYIDEKANQFGPHTLVNLKDWWEIPMIATSNKSERTGFPTQKPLPLYERMVRASSNKGDVILDPFAGCATTLVAAERLKRQWVGIDIWDNAKAVVLQRLEHEGMISEGTDKLHGHLFTEDVHFTAKPPKRTDDADTASPFLRVKERIREPDSRTMSRSEMYDFLLTQHGPTCQGCDRSFDDRRYLQLDHNTPRSDGGLNHISNRVLLCGPCNRAKSHIYTLSGLQRLNKKNGWMAK